MTDTEIVPIAELEVEMTVGELLAAMKKDTPMTDTAPAEDITDGAQKAYASDAVVKALIGKDAADTIDHQSAEIERLGREKYDLTIELEAAKEIIRCLEARWQAAQADYRAAESERDEARAEVERLRNALKMIAGDNWSTFHVDSKGAHVADQIVTEMQRIASEALIAQEHAND